MDFLLISLLCFDQNIPMPAIAAAMDFMNSQLLAETLRRCGAFFIRRNVKKVRVDSNFIFFFFLFIIFVGKF